jgi:hypothetical protein
MRCVREKICFSSDPPAEFRKKVPFKECPEFAKFYIRANFLVSRAFWCAARGAVTLDFLNRIGRAWTRRTRARVRERALGAGGESVTEALARPRCSLCAARLLGALCGAHTFEDMKHYPINHITACTDATDAQSPR